MKEQMQQQSFRGGRGYQGYTRGQGNYRYYRGHSRGNTQYQPRRHLGSRNFTHMRYFNCNEPGHLTRDCPKVWVNQKHQIKIYCRP